MRRVRIHPGQLALWVPLPNGGWARWRGRPPVRFVCIGCARRPVKERHTYCRTCRERMAAGKPVDLDEFVTVKDWRQLRKRIPDEGSGWRRKE